MDSPRETEVWHSTNKGHRDTSAQRLYQEAVRLYLDGKIDAAIALLADDKLRRSAEQAEKTLTDAIQGWRLKASLFTLKFRFEEAEKAYETALHYINRETNPVAGHSTRRHFGPAG